MKFVVQRVKNAQVDIEAKTVGKIEWFQGFEEIYCQNDLVYECTYHGGIL